MFPIESFKNSLLKFVEILNRQKIQFHLTGGITGVAYGEPRLTQDIDMVIQNAASAANLESLITELAESEFVFTEAAVREAISNKGMFQLFDTAESLKLDVYPREMIEGELSRSQELEIFESVRLPIASRLDAAISKLIWSSKGSHKSRRDFRQISIRSSETENEKIRAMANKLGLEELLDEVLTESDEIKD
jgi:hypothetical protein